MSDKPMTTIFERLRLRAQLVKAVRLAIDTDPRIYHVSNSEIIFAIPHGTDPETIHKKSYVFRQVFGENVEINGNLKRFTLSIPSAPMPKRIPFMLADWQSSLDKYDIPIICGVDSAGNRIAFDLAERPHTLISGETGSGKSSLLRAIITSIILSKDPKDIRFILGDLKRSEFGLFRNLPHVESVSVDISDLELELTKIEAEMQRRGDLLDEAEVTHIKSLPKPLPYIVVAIDEVALLRKEKDIMRIIEDISSIGRSLGVLLMLSMQRPDAKVLDGRLKNNLTVRISGRQSNAINAGVAGLPGAETIGQTERGRMLIDLDGIKRIQAPWLSDENAKRILKPLKVEKKAESKSKPIKPTNDNVIDFGVLGGNRNE